MNHEEYERMVNDRRTAINKFPSLFKNCHLKEDATLDELDKLYNSYVNSQMQDAISYWELQPIKRAYYYVNNLIEKRYIPDSSKISQGIYEQYHLLIDMIGQYSFNITKDVDGETIKTEGYYQNLNNKDILFELSILEPYFNDIMTWTDIGYKRFSDKEEKEKISSTCAKLGASLNISYSFLAQCQLQYKQRKPNARREWKKAKNISYRDILRFYESLTNELEVGCFFTKKIYNRFLKELKRSPHYYCFLTDDEKIEQGKDKYYYPTGDKEIDELIKRDSRGKYKVKKRIRQ